MFSLDTYLWFPLQSHNSTSQLAVLPGDISIPLHSNSSILSEEKKQGVLLFTGKINIYYLPAGRSVLRKTVPEVLSTARGCRPRAVLKTEGTVFLNTDRPRPANNIFIFFLLFFKS